MRSCIAPQHAVYCRPCIALWAYLTVVVVPYVGMSGVDPVQSVLSPRGREVAGGLSRHQPLVVGEQVIQQEL